MITAPLSPLAIYRQALEQDGFVPDAAQQSAVQALQDCYTALLQPAKRKASINGVYLWGPVGRGKTWLMNQFFACLESAGITARRQHFHHFMQWVHRRLFELIGTADPLHALAKELASQIRVLCFDELFVSDIGDALILGGLLQVLCECGVVLVATSNQTPDQLYANGFNRERFLPAIAALQQHMQVVPVAGSQDHRQHPGPTEQRYWLSKTDDPLGNQRQAERVFAEMTIQRPANEIARGTIQVGHRELLAEGYTERVAWFTYAQLCEQPLSALDFIGICDRFEALLLTAVPCLSAAQRVGKIARGTEDASAQVLAGDRELPMLSIHDDGVRRFIALVDECYDRQIPLYVQAAVPMSELYTQGYLAFAFRRTLSRLQEMQLRRYGRVAGHAG